MGIFNSPKCNLEENLCGLGDFGPYELSNGNGNCYSITTCEDACIYYPIPCNPFTGAELVYADLTDIEFSISYQSSDDANPGTINFLNWKQSVVPDNFGNISVFQGKIDIEAADTADLPGGVSQAQIKFYTAEGNWAYYQFDLCVTRPVYAEPCVVVTGAAGGTTPFQQVGNQIQLWFHESDTVHAGREWESFTVEWGDGTSDTINVAGQTPSASWTLSHTYATSGDYYPTVRGVLTSDANDPCDPALENCVAPDPECPVTIP